MSDQAATVEGVRVRPGDAFVGARAGELASVIVEVRWDGPRGRCVEMFGPWSARQDGSHLDEISAFVSRWHAAEGRSGVDAVAWLVTSPETYDRRVAST